MLFPSWSVVTENPATTRNMQATCQVLGPWRIEPHLDSRRFSAHVTCGSEMSVCRGEILAKASAGHPSPGRLRPSRAASQNPKAPAFTARSPAAKHMKWGTFCTPEPRHFPRTNSRASEPTHHQSETSCQEPRVKRTALSARNCTGLVAMNAKYPETPPVKFG